MPNIMRKFVEMLEREETAVLIQETEDDRYFKAIYTLVGESKEYAVEFFDGQPISISWEHVRLNSDGHPF